MGVGCREVGGGGRVSEFGGVWGASSAPGVRRVMGGVWCGIWWGGAGLEGERGWGGVGARYRRAGDAAGVLGGEKLAWVKGVDRKDRHGGRRGGDRDGQCGEGRGRQTDTVG